MTVALSVNDTNNGNGYSQVERRGLTEGTRRCMLNVGVVAVGVLSVAGFICSLRCVRNCQNDLTAHNITQAEHHKLKVEKGLCIAAAILSAIPAVATVCTVCFLANT